MTSICRHCQRRITNDDGLGWIDPEATGDDSIWRETCDSHDTFEADHEPELDEEEDSLTDESSDSFICHTDEDGDHVEHPTGCSTGSRTRASSPPSRCGAPSSSGSRRPSPPPTAR